ELGKAVSPAVRGSWVQAIGAAPSGDAGEALLRMEIAAEAPTPADHLSARRLLQLQLLTRRNDPEPAQTWGQDAARVLAGAYEPGAGRRGGGAAIPVPGGVIYIGGSNLESVRRDLHNLDERVSKAHEVAEAAMDGNGRANQRFFERIHAFNERTRELHRFTDMDRIDPRELRPLIETLANEARSVDQAMRQAHAISEVWDEWAAVLQTLDRLMDEVRS
ncbi:MAG: hypothetical protein ABIT01_06510, partial [Thermoanaerobaculia bacterium]